MERLQKLIAAAGVASRRHAEELITSGQVTVNGEVITELGTKADPERDHIKVRGKLINPILAKRKNVYVLLNKPKGYLTSVSDPEGRPLYRVNPLACCTCRLVGSPWAAGAFRAVSYGRSGSWKPPLSHRPTGPAF